MEMYVPLEIWQLFCDKLGIKSQIMLISTCWEYYTGLFIYSISLKYKGYDEYKYSYHLTNDILRQQKFSRIRILDLSYNAHVTDLSFLPNLKILYVQGGNCAINQKSIDTLDLVELYVSNNKKINDVRHMKNLKILDASYGSWIDQNGIMGLDLLELNACDNKRIKDVRHMKNLRILDASYKKCGITQEGIEGLNLEKLEWRGNDKIKILCQKIITNDRINYLKKWKNNAVNNFFNSLNDIFLEQNTDENFVTTYYSEYEFGGKFDYDSHEKIILETNNILLDQIKQEIENALFNIKFSMGKRKNNGELPDQPPLKKVKKLIF